MGITIEIDNLAGINYLEYYITGFQQLKEKGIVDRVKITFGTDTWGQAVQPGYIPYYKNIFRLKAGPKFPSLVKPLTIANPTLGYYPSFYLFGRVSDGSTVKKFVIDTFDTPWDYPFIQDCDFYFKSQYPKTFSEGYVDLNRHIRMTFPQTVIANRSKVRPLILGRPLSRILNYSTNLRLLKKFGQIRSRSKREKRLLVFYGTPIVHPAYDHEPYHNPSIKRAEIATFVHDKVQGAKIILNISPEIERLGVLSAETLALKNKAPVTDATYLKWMRNSYSTLNISGLDGSIPWRIIDSYMSGMVPISDSFIIDWYEPLIAGKDYLSIGELGYELLEDVDLDGSFAQLKEYVENIETLWHEMAEYRSEKYDQYYSPEMVARYMLSEMGVL